MSGELTGLLERVRAATGPDKDLDRSIAMAVKLGPKKPKSRYDGTWKPNLGGQTGYGYDSPEEATGWIRYPDADRYAPPPHYHPCKHYTTKIDVIVALIERKLPGFFWIAEKRGEANFYGTIMHPIGRAGAGPEKGATPALALCAAFLAALSAQEDKL